MRADHGEQSTSRENVRCPDIFQSAPGKVTGENHCRIIHQSGDAAVDSRGQRLNNPIVSSNDTDRQSRLTPPARPGPAPTHPQRAGIPAGPPAAASCRGFRPRPTACGNAPGPPAVRRTRRAGILAGHADAGVTDRLKEPRSAPARDRSDRRPPARQPATRRPPPRRWPSRSKRTKNNAKLYREGVTVG